MQSLSKMLLKSRALPFLVCLSNFSTALALSPGLYEIKGDHQELGAFAGLAQIRGEEVIRKVKFEQFKYKDLAVELVWSGRISDKALMFKLKTADTLTAFDGSVLPKTEMLSEFVVRSTVAPKERISLPGSTETWTLKTKDSGSQPLWKSERYQVLSRGQSDGLALKLAQKLGLDKANRAFFDWAKTSEYAGRISDKHWLIYDPTDFQTYRKSPDTLIVANKTVNPLSLAEALNKRNAYAKKLSEKSEHFEAELLSYNLNPVGILEIAQVDEKRQKIRSEVEGDAALWTGVYAWSQALRYKQDKNPQALMNLKKSLEGLMTLIEITENEQEFARTILVSPENEPATADRLNQGRGRFADLKWQNTGNNDMIKGVFLAFAAAYPFLSDRDPLKQSIAQMTDRLIRLNAVRERSYNLGIAYGLKALYQNDATVFEDFSNRTLNLVSVLADEFDFSDGFHFEAIADWSGIHLTTITTLSQLILAKNLETRFHRRSSEAYFAKKIRKNAESRLFQLSETYQSARRDFLTVVAHTYSPQARQSKAHQARAKLALWSLREVPAPRFHGQGVVDHTRNSSWSMSRWASLPWKFLKNPVKIKDEPGFGDRIQGVHSFPIYESLSWSSPYLWKEAPFRVIDESPKNKVYFSADYLIFYRVAREGGLITGKD